MRTIKFRAWEIDKKIMWTHEQIDKFDKDGLFLWGYLLQDEKKHGFELMQFTGLHDKNGKEIYEGDIVASYGWGIDKQFRGNFVIVWDEDETGWNFWDPNHAPDRYDFIKAIQRCEVIGNIHQNPEIIG